MSSPRKIITVFGANGNQGSGVINIVLQMQSLSDKYIVRAVTRDPSSAKAQALVARGAEVASGDLNSLDSLKAAVRGSYGVFAMTDFWSIHSYDVEVQQGKNIFEACKAEGVQHLIYSSLPHATRMTRGVLPHLAHYDSKATVQAYMDANKGDMYTSFFRPGMFLSFLPNLLRKTADGTPILILPLSSDSTPWPMVDPPRDGGKYIMGLFEAGSKANGVTLNCVSSWTNAHEIVQTLEKVSGREVLLKNVSQQEFEADYPENIAEQLTETLRVAGEFSIFGPGAEVLQPSFDQWLVEGSEKPISLEQWINENGPWKFEGTTFLDNLAAQKTKHFETVGEQQAEQTSAQREAIAT